MLLNKFISAEETILFTWIENRSLLLHLYKWGMSDSFNRISLAFSLAPKTTVAPPLTLVRTLLTRASWFRPAMLFVTASSRGTD